MPSFPDNYAPDRVISLHIEHIVIPIGIFLNLKSLSIVCGSERKDESLDMINESWKLNSLVKLLSAMPLLITLKVKGYSCCNQAIGWLYIDAWDEMLQNLKALQQVDIDICLGIPYRKNSAARFNEIAAQKIQTCKRINLTVGPRRKRKGLGLVQISASLSMT
ncbi:unnamed protein product [Rotaria magnacalcarata]|uniref:Uncharacterized protein n=1 Tax=Rotaria magnacalcarata TaxID=392030 RepID=A0A816R6L2_9BILA|nr:unnamed protein product [Rotaria magnacalcarata]